MAEPALSHAHSFRERLVDNLSAHRNELVAVFSRLILLSITFCLSINTYSSIISMEFILND